MRFAGYLDRYSDGRARAVVRCFVIEDTKLESTVRYLGVEVDDALEMSEGLEL